MQKKQKKSPGQAASVEREIELLFQWKTYCHSRYLLKATDAGFNQLIPS